MPEQTEHQRLLKQYRAAFNNALIKIDGWKEPVLQAYPSDLKTRYAREPDEDVRRGMRLQWKTLRYYLDPKNTYLSPHEKLRRGAAAAEIVGNPDEYYETLDVPHAGLAADLAKEELKAFLRAAWQEVNIQKRDRIERIQKRSVVQPDTAHRLNQVLGRQDGHGWQNGSNTFGDYVFIAGIGITEQRIIIASLQDMGVQFTQPSSNTIQIQMGAYDNNGQHHANFSLIERYTNKHPSSARMMEMLVPGTTWQCYPLLPNALPSLVARIDPLERAAIMTLLDSKKISVTPNRSDPNLLEIPLENSPQITGAYLREHGINGAFHAIGNLNDKRKYLINQWDLHDYKRAHHIPDSQSVRKEAQTR